MILEVGAKAILRIKDTNLQQIAEMYQLRTIAASARTRGTFGNEAEERSTVG